MIKAFNIYLCGVGGQGIGMLSEILLRAADYAGHPVKGVDTHGLAQRGGIVISHLRLGPGVHSPLTLENGADLVIALEKHEALRGVQDALRDACARRLVPEVEYPHYTQAMRDLMQGRVLEAKQLLFETACKVAADV